MDAKIDQVYDDEQMDVCAELRWPQFSILHTRTGRKIWGRWGTVGICPHLLLADTLAQRDSIIGGPETAIIL